VHHEARPAPYRRCPADPNSPESDHECAVIPRQRQPPRTGGARSETMTTQTVRIPLRVRHPWTELLAGGGRAKPAYRGLSSSGSDPYPQRTSRPTGNEHLQHMRFLAGTPLRRRSLQRATSAAPGRAPVANIRWVAAPVAHLLSGGPAGSAAAAVSGAPGSAVTRVFATMGRRRCRAHRRPGKIVRLDE